MYVTHSKHVNSRYSLFSVGLMLVVGGCGSDSATNPQPPPSPDITAPVVQIVAPDTAGIQFGSIEFDEDGDGLLDLRVRWSDAGGLDLSTVTVTGHMGVTASVSDTENLAQVWTVEELSDSALVLHETIDALLRGKRVIDGNRLIVSVADTAGNIGADTLAFPMPHANLHRIVPTGLTDGISLDMVVCPDDLRLYQIYGRRMVVMNTETFEVIGTFRDQFASDILTRMICIPGDPIVYATTAVDRFNRTTFQWEREIQPPVGSDAIIASKADSAIIYVTEITSATVARIDRFAGVRLGEIGLPGSQFPDQAFGLEVLPGDAKIYVGRASEGGLIVGDPATGAELGRINLDPVNGGNSTLANIRLSPDGRILYAAPNFGSYRGIVAIDTKTDQIVKHFESSWTPTDVEVNQSGTRLWLAQREGPGNLPARSWLIDPTLQGWDILAQLQHPVLATPTRWVQAAAFHPNGRLLFQARDDDIDIFLIRE